MGKVGAPQLGLLTARSHVLKRQEADWLRWGACAGAGTNHLGHFLLANLLLPEIQKAPEGSLKRVIIVGSITGVPSVAA